MAPKRVTEGTFSHPAAWRMIKTELKDPKEAKY